MRPKTICIMLGVVIGGWIGSSIGIAGFCIAGFFGAIVGTLPTRTYPA